MKRTVLVLLFVTLFAAGAAFGVARWLRCQTCAAAAEARDAGWLTRELKLSGEQAATVTALEADYRAALSAACARHCGARARLSDTLSAASVDQAAATGCVEEMCAAEAVSERVTLDHIMKVRAVLTPEQQARYAELIRGQLSGACPMRVH